MTRPAITVITAVRNGAQCLEDTINSILSQEYPRLEYLVVDGASTDGTLSIIRKYDTLISRWITEPDTGISDAFNKGAHLATGDALLYMNAGDRFVGPDSLSRLVEGAPGEVRFDESIIYGDAVVEFPSVVRPQVTDHRRLGLDGYTPICHQAALIGAKLQRRFPYDTRLKISMDLDLWLRCKIGSVSFYKVPVPICRYAAGGISGDPNFAVHRTAESGLVRLMNSRSNLTAKSIGSLFLEVLATSLKQRLRATVGPATYRAIKRAAGRQHEATSGKLLDSV